MFCLRSWIPILFFLMNASPVYLVLFISATYVLNRPCVYCSILLAILVIALFDFKSNWFEPRTTSWLGSDTGSLSGNGSLLSNATVGTTNTITDRMFETAAIIASAVDSTATAVAQAAGEAWRKMGVQGEGAPAEVAKSLVARREWRFPCFEINIRM